MLADSVASPLLGEYHHPNVGVNVICFLGLSRVRQHFSMVMNRQKVIRLAGVVALVLLLNLAVAQENVVNVAEIEQKLSDHASLVKDGEIEFNFILSGRQPIAVDRFEKFVADLIVIAEQNPDEVAEFVLDSFPGGPLVIQDGAYVFDGKQYREKLKVPSPNDQTVVRETTQDSGLVSMYWSDSNQATIFPANKPVWKHFSLSDFWRIPRAHELNEATASKVSQSQVLLSSPGVEMELDWPSGLVRRSSIGRGGNARHYLQLAFVKFNQVPIPTVRIDVAYRDERLYRFSVITVKDARMNEGVDDTFKLSVPHNTIVVDARSGYAQATSFRAPRSLEDVASWLIDAVSVR